MDDFKKEEFVILDVETTGLSPAAGDRVIEVAALKIQGLEVRDRFYSLLDPQRPLSYGAYLVNGITPQMLRGAPRAEEILPRFFDFLGRACLVGHNIPFDLRFLASEAERIRHPWQPESTVVDTVRLARWLLPEAGRYRLEAVAHCLEIEVAGLHRAMADVELTFQVFRRLLEMSFRRDVTDLAALVRRGERKTTRDRAAAAWDRPPAR